MDKNWLQQVIMYYNISYNAVTESTSVPVPETCNGFTVKNNGTTIVLLNGMIPIVPGSSVAIGGNYGEIYGGRCDIRFQVPAPPPGTITNSAVVMFKFYMSDRGYDNPSL